MNAQIDAKLITRLLGTALIIALAGRAVAASPTTEAPLSVVKFADLNLNSAQGIALLYKRIHNAAGHVCDSSSSDRVFGEVALAIKKCVDESESRAIGSIHNIALETYYSKKSGRAIPMVASNK